MCKVEIRCLLPQSSLFSPLLIIPFTQMNSLSIFDNLNASAAISMPRSFVPVFSDEDWKKMQGGEILTRRDKSPAGNNQSGGAGSSMILDLSPQIIWEVVVAVESRLEFIDDLEEIHLVKWQGHRVWLNEAFRVLWKVIHFSVTWTLDPEKGHLRWALDRDKPHDIADTTGSWTVIPIPKSSSTLVLYENKVDTGMWIPAFVERSLTGKALPKMMEAMRAEMIRRGQKKQAKIP